MTETTSLPTLKCDHCGHEWLPRVPDPIQCPRCKRLREVTPA